VQQFVRKLLHHVSQLNALEDFPNIIVTILLMRVKIVPDGCREQKRVLGNDGDLGPEGAAAAV
jgi:hypothetical protein